MEKINWDCNCGKGDCGHFRQYARVINSIIDEVRSLNSLLDKQNTIISGLKNKLAKLEKLTPKNYPSILTPEITELS